MKIHVRIFLVSLKRFESLDKFVGVVNLLRRK